MKLSEKNELEQLRAFKQMMETYCNQGCEIVIPTYEDDIKHNFDDVYQTAMQNYDMNLDFKNRISPEEILCDMDNDIATVNVVMNLYDEDYEMLLNRTDFFENFGYENFDEFLNDCTATIYVNFTENDVEMYAIVDTPTTSTDVIIPLYETDKEKLIDEFNDTFGTEKGYSLEHALLEAKLGVEVTAINFDNCYDSRNEVLTEEENNVANVELYLDDSQYKALLDRLNDEQLSQLMEFTKFEGIPVTELTFDNLRYNDFTFDVYSNVTPFSNTSETFITVYNSEKENATFEVPLTNNEKSLLYEAVKEGFEKDGIDFNFSEISCFIMGDELALFEDKTAEKITIENSDLSAYQIEIPSNYQNEIDFLKKEDVIIENGEKYAINPDKFAEIFPKENTQYSKLFSNEEIETAKSTFENLKQADLTNNLTNNLTNEKTEKSENVKPKKKEQESIEL